MVIKMIQEGNLKIKMIEEVVRKYLGLGAGLNLKEVEKLTSKNGVVADFAGKVIFENNTESGSRFFGSLRRYF
jgi:hypothetical protein